MIFKKYWLRPNLFIILLSLSQFASADIVNGNFDTGLSGWSTVTNGGGVQWEASGKAVLATGAGAAPYSSVLVQGDDGSFSFGSPIMIGANDNLFKFDFSFSSLAADALESVSGTATDNLQVWLYDANGLGDVLMATLNLLSTGSSLTFNLSPYIGHAVAFSFELNDEDDGADTQVSVDNIRTEQQSSPIPAPGTIALQLTGFLMMAGLNGYASRKGRHPKKNIGAIIGAGNIRQALASPDLGA